MIWKWEKIKIFWKFFPFFSDFSSFGFNFATILQVFAKMSWVATGRGYFWGTGTSTGDKTGGCASSSTQNWHKTTSEEFFFVCFFFVFFLLFLSFFGARERKVSAELTLLGRERVCVGRKSVSGTVVAAGVGQEWDSLWKRRKNGEFWGVFEDFLL